MSQVQALSAPLGRFLIAAMFLVAGLQKSSAYEGTAGYMEAMGVPSEMLPLVILLEIGGGLAIIVGWQTRLVATAFAGFSVLSAIIFHWNFADQIQSIMFMKNFAIAGGFLFLVAHGPGAYALDNRASTNRSNAMAVE
jgi:putative oxidoreductase